MTEILVDVWLYGGLAVYGGDQSQGSYANLQVRLQQAATVADLLAFLQMPTEERGITFINGELSAMVGLQPDLPHILQDGDRIAFFHLRSMWPFQYRHGVPMIGEMAGAMNKNPDLAIRHSYNTDT
jgi:sulfur carrier protein ThiS